MRIKYKTFEMADDNSRISLTIENNIVNQVDLTQPLSIKEFFQAVNDLQSEIQKHNINFIEKTKNEVKDILPTDISVLAEAIKTPEIASVVSSIVNDMKNQANTLNINSSQLVDSDIRMSNQSVNQTPRALVSEFNNTRLDREVEFLQSNNTSFSIEKKVEIPTQPIEEKKIVRINNHDVEYTGKNYIHVADTDVNPQYASALSTNELLLGKMGY